MSRHVLLATSLMFAVVAFASADEPTIAPQDKPQWQRTLHDDDEKRAADLQKRIDAAEQAGKYHEAVKLHEELLSLRTSAQGGDHWKVVTQKWSLERARKLSVLPEEQRAKWSFARQAHSDAEELEGKEKYAEAQALYQRNLDLTIEVLGEKHPDTSTSYNNLALNLDSQGKYSEAEPLFQKALALCLELLGEKHLHTAVCYNNLAAHLHEQTKYAEAQPLYQKTLEVRLEVQGEKYVDTATSYDNLAWNLDRLEKFGEAQPLHEKALGLYRELLGERHLDTAICYDNYAWNLDGQKKFAEAQPVREKALALYHELLGEEHEDTAFCCRELAYNLISQDKYAEAEPVCRRALELTRKLLGEEHAQTAETYRKLAVALEGQQKFADAEAPRRRALERCRALYGQEHFLTADSYNDLAYNLMRQGNLLQAQTAYQQAVDLRLALFGEKHLATAVSYNGLAICLHRQQKYHAAEPFFRKALEARREILGERHAATAASYANLANNLDLQGKHAEAQPVWQAAVDVNRALFGEGHFETATSYSDLAYNLNLQGRFADAQPFHERALALRRDLLGETHRDTANSYNGLALCLHGQGRFADGEPVFRKALELRRELFGDKDLTTAQGFNNLAFSLTAQGKYADAEPLYLRALDIQRALVGDKHSDIATSHQNLAFNYNAQLNFADAEIHYRKALAINRELHGDHDADTAASYLGLAYVLANQRRLDDALPVFQKALEIRRDLYADRHPDTAAGYSGLAYCLGLLNEFAKSQEQHERALELRRALRGEYHPETAQSYTDLARIVAIRGGIEDSLSLLARAALSYEAARLAVGRRGLDRAIYADEQSPYPLLAAVLAHASRPAEAWFAAESDFARGMNDETTYRRGRSLTAGHKTRQVEIAARLDQLNPRIVQLLGKREPTDAEKQEIGKLENERRSLEDQLADLAIELSRPELATLAEVQAALFHDAAMVLWDDTRDGEQFQGHWGCVVRDSGAPIWQQLPGSGPDARWTLADLDLPRKLGDAVARAAPAAEIERLAAKLHAQRIAPLEGHLEGVKRLFVVPVRAMTGVPVEMLAEKYTVSYLPSGTFLARLADRSAPQGSLLLALGHPTFPAVQPAPQALAAQREADKMVLALTRGGNWKELPGTGIEVARLRKLVGDNLATVLTRSAASEQQVERLRASGKLAEFRYLHFATHGEPNNARSFESALILSQEQISKDVDLGGGKYYDGKLTANEVLENWQLNADLVTLSACESALGRPGGGDGLLGFAQAFLLAGARSVCLSLWKVDDTATALLMDRFYQNLLGKRADLAQPMPKAAALAEAKRWLRGLTLDEATKLAADMTDGVARGNNEPALKLVVPSAEAKEPAAPENRPFSHPRYWAAFILIGDPD